MSSDEPVTCANWPKKAEAIIIEWRTETCAKIRSAAASLFHQRQTTSY
jgi:hypothetical protein